MQMRWGAAFVVALGCSRGLELPNVDPLSVSPASATVAPREALQLAAQGGVPPYSFALQQRQSGERASVSSAGAYLAGDDGPAADVVRVTDSSGAQVDAAIAVGPSLALSPASALVAPGGRVVFTATGGKRPYAYSIVDGPGAVGAAGDYVAGAQGDSVAHVKVRDATADAAAIVEVHVGPAVSILPRTQSVAPYATLDFVAIGGQPPYRYSVQSTDGASIDAETGHYQAGAGSGAAAVADTVTVTDALAQAATASVQTGPPLAAAAPSEVHPFQPVRLTPTGGLAPYSFAFAARGDRTRGSIDAVTGVYMPGSNFGAHDAVEVRDATPGGRAVLTMPMPPVGSLVLSATRPRNCLAADMDGDGRQDAVLITPVTTGVESRIDIELMVQDAPPVVIHNNIADIRAVRAADLNGDGRDDLIVEDGTSIRAYLANSDGSLAPSILVAARRSTNRTVPLMVSGSAGGAHSIWYVDDVADASACAGNATAVMRADWAAQATAAGAPACVAPGKTALGSPVAALALGDFNHDGIQDLAWLPSEYPGGLRIFFGPDFLNVAPQVLARPSGAAFSGFYGLIAGDRDGDGIDDLLVPVVTDDSVARFGFSVMTGSATSLALGPYTDPMPGNPAQPFGYVAAPGSEVLLWTAQDGNIYRIGADLAPKNPPPPAQPFAVFCVALPDVNADGVPDLMASGSGSNRAVVLLGDGDGGYGRRPHYLVGQVAVSADVDGDGADDIVYKSDAFTLQTLFGGNHQLAKGPQTVFDSSFNFAFQPLYGSARRDLLLLTGTAPSMARSLGDGSWAPAEPIHDASGPRSSEFGIMAAELGGAAPGVDFIEVQSDFSTLIPLIRSDPANPSLVTPLDPIPMPRPGGCSPGGLYQTVDDYDRNGITDIVEGCDDGYYVLLGTREGGPLSFAAHKLPALPFGTPVLGPVLSSGRVAVAMYSPGTSTISLGSFTWNGASFDAAFAAEPRLWGGNTDFPTLTKMNLGDGAEALVVVTRHGTFEYHEAVDGTFTFVRLLAQAASVLGLAPSAGGPVDLLLSGDTTFQAQQGTLFLNDGHGSFP